jgi:hypothetical protein
MFLPGMKSGPRKTNRNRCARNKAKTAAKNRRRRNGLKK